MTMDDKDSEFQFIKEKIKDKPINKRRVLEIGALIVLAAVVFGAISASVFSAMVRDSINTEQMREVSIAEEDEQPQEVTVSQNTLSETKESDESVSSGEAPQIINNITEKVSLTTEDYKDLYRSLSDAAEDAMRSMVTVTGVASDTDWFDSTYEDTSSGSGIILANNGKELLIVASSDVTEDADKITLTFADGTTVDGKVKQVDQDTGIEIIAAPMEAISSETLEAIKEAKLGSSRSSKLPGTPVMAVGRPLGSNGNVAYGLVTSNSRVMNMTDRNAHIISTDIYGSKEASGAIFNYEGQVLGIISRKTTPKDVENLISGYSISDMKDIIESLSNDKSTTCLGIKGTNVTDAAHEELGVPYGAYVTSVIMNSPAMSAGIQSGDVITKIGTKEISDFGDYTETIMSSQPGDDAVVTVRRYARGEYAEMSFDVTYTTLDKDLIE